MANKLDSVKKSIDPINPDPEDAIKAMGNLRNRTSFDVESYVHNPDNGFHYHWINKKETRVNQVKALGYEVVTPDNDKARGGIWSTGAGAWMAGDRILMRLRRDIRERDQAKKARKHIPFTKQQDDMTNSGKFVTPEELAELNGRLTDVEERLTSTQV